MELLAVPLNHDVTAWFTGRDRTWPDPAVGVAGNLSHRRPHLPAELARERRRAGGLMDLVPDSFHFMRQVHGASVGVVDASTPLGAELRGVDALVTAEADRPLAVQVADCIPILIAAPGVVAAVHAGRRGVAAEVVRAALDTVRRLAGPGERHAVLGPAIGGCCYEVPDQLRDQIAARWPEAAATTTWGTPSLDLSAAVEGQLVTAGVDHVQRVGSCTRCDPDGRWFSHRGDPGTGRQLGVVVRRASGGRRASTADAEAAA